MITIIIYIIIYIIIIIITIHFLGESDRFSVVNPLLLPVEVGGMPIHHMMVLVGMPLINRK